MNDVMLVTEHREIIFFLNPSRNGSRISHHILRISSFSGNGFKFSAVSSQHNGSHKVSNMDGSSILISSLKKIALNTKAVFLAQSEFEYQKGVTDVLTLLPKHAKPASWLGTSMVLSEVHNVPLERPYLKKSMLWGTSSVINVDAPGSKFFIEFMIINLDLCQILIPFYHRNKKQFIPLIYEDKPGLDYSRKMPKRLEHFSIREL